jgi:hypothetical protein
MSVQTIIHIPIRDSDSTLSSISHFVRGERPACWSITVIANSFARSLSGVADEERIEESYRSLGSQLSHGHVMRIDRVVVAIAGDAVYRQKLWIQ